MNEYEFEVEYQASIGFTISADSCEESIEILKEEALYEEVGRGQDCDRVVATCKKTGKRVYLS